MGCGYGKPRLSRAFGDARGPVYWQAVARCTLAWAGKGRAGAGARSGWKTDSCGRVVWGAALTPPLSLVADDLGIYYDPTRESRLERLTQRVRPRVAPHGPKADCGHSQGGLVKST